MALKSNVCLQNKGPDILYSFWFCSAESKAFHHNEKPSVQCGRTRIYSPYEIKVCVLGEKSILIFCFFCRPEHTETDNCLGKLRNWCLNCVVSESWWFCQLWCSEEVRRAAELVITPLDVKEASQMSRLVILWCFPIMGDRG